MRTHLKSGVCAFLLAVGSLCEAASDLEDAPGYVGLRDPQHTPPLSSKWMGSHLINSVNGQDYVVSLFKMGAGHVLMLERLERDASGQPRSSEVVAAAKAPRVPRGYALAMGVCYRSKAQDPDIIALARRDESRPMWRDIRSAWRADVSRQKFTGISAQDLECENESYGKD